MSVVEPDHPGAEPAAPSWRQRATDWFGVDDDWQRPQPALERSDVWVAVIYLLVAILCVELARGFIGIDTAVWRTYLTLPIGALILLYRRRWPIIAGLLMTAHFVVTGNIAPEVAYMMPFQMAVFFSLFSMVAWARDRVALLLALGAVALTWIIWIAWDFAVGSGVQQMIDDELEVTGVLPPITSAVLFTALINVVFFTAATVLGQANWRDAQTRDQLAGTTATVIEQSGLLRDQAVIQERLRIARELHDVVAHHVSVMGVQAAGARQVLHRDPDLAAQAVGQVERSARQALDEMRGLLGTLRSGEDPQSWAPAPGVDQIGLLVESFTTGGFEAHYSVVTADAEALDLLSPAASLTLYRTVQEALTNVRRHSTASSATVTLRVEPAQGFSEVEIVDSGRTRHTSSGSGLGHEGMRERVASHGGLLEVGPRRGGGYRVRVRLPLAVPERA